MVSKLLAENEAGPHDLQAGKGRPTPPLHSMLQDEEEDQEEFVAAAVAAAVAVAVAEEVVRRRRCFRFYGVWGLGFRGLGLMNIASTAAQDLANRQGLHPKSCIGPLLETM